MGVVYATSADYIAFYGALTESEATQVTSLLTTASASIRMAAKNRNRDLDSMIADDSDLAEIAKSVVCDIVHRYLEQVNSSGASTLTQESQSALGYSWSGTYANTGGGMTVLNKDMKRLGLLRPRYGVVDLLEGRVD